ncbi:MAG: hypothetical protein AAB847_02520 [Patescibacteria group bacterium]
MGLFNFFQKKQANQKPISKETYEREFISIDREYREQISQANKMMEEGKKFAQEYRSLDSNNIEKQLEVSAKMDNAIIERGRAVEAALISRKRAMELKDRYIKSLEERVKDLEKKNKLMQLRTLL